MLYEDDVNGKWNEREKLCLSEEKFLFPGGDVCGLSRKEVEKIYLTRAIFLHTFSFSLRKLFSSFFCAHRKCLLSFFFGFAKKKENKEFHKHLSWTIKWLMSINLLLLFCVFLWIRKKKFTFYKLVSCASFLFINRNILIL